MSQHVETQLGIQEGNFRKITLSELMENLSSFAEDFQDFDPKVLISTPQADRGIGPVQYDIKLRTNTKPSTAVLRVLNKIIELEKFRGDQLIKFDASMLCVATGREDSHGFLPPGCRIAIRTEIQQATLKICVAQKLTHQKDADREIIGELIRSTADRSNFPPNPAEIALLCDLAPKVNRHGAAHGINTQHNDFSFLGILNSIMQRQTEQNHTRRIRKIIRRQFKLGADEVMAMSEEDEFDDGSDMDDNEEPLSGEEDMDGSGIEAAE